jgi:hypothetical protein
MTWVDYYISQFIERSEIEREALLERAPLLVPGLPNPLLGRPEADRGPEDLLKDNCPAQPFTTRRAEVSDIEGSAELPPMGDRRPTNLALER